MNSMENIEKKVTLRQLQSLLGKLNFACRAVVPGRAFCRWLIDATVGVKKKPPQDPSNCKHVRGSTSLEVISR